MGLAKADPSVYIERVIRLRWHVDDCQGCGVCKLVAGADDKRIEGVLRIKRELQRFGFYRPNHTCRETLVIALKDLRSGGNTTQRLRLPNRRRRRVIDHKPQLVTIEIKLVKGLLDNIEVVVAYPITEHFVWNPQVDTGIIHPGRGNRLEPHIETLLVHPFRDGVEYGWKQIRMHCRAMKARFRFDF